MSIPEHKAIIKRLIEEAEKQHGPTRAFVYTSKLLAALNVLDKTERQEGIAS